ncbi:diguanylate cyclase (GGDEF)-like protein [Methylobacterium sp. BE186]|uniref:EAL domain-containing protein n=1 Tax=Methylobacterium sp. BE186 TaxID=2817715 RepID=UPI00285E299C|nr:EAL domain-containing protein [Methylobacterium sp. BE186]MDR7039334.1 diguanylate cyclase (GGDEF)-like protein [Methylobacterium sp. BE186]
MIPTWCRLPTRSPLPAPHGVQPAHGEAPRRDGQGRREARAALLAESLQVAKLVAVVQVLIALGVAVVFRDTPSRAYVFGLVVAIGCVATMMIVAMRHVRTVLAREPSDRTVVGCTRLLSFLHFLLGLVWSTMPPTLIERSLSDGYSAIGTSVGAGLLATTIMLGSIFALGACFALPLLVGVVIAAARLDAPFDIFFVMLLAIYAGFLLNHHHHMCTLARRRVLDRITVGRQGETIGLLLNDFAEGASDWLWETDADGRLRHGPTRMAEALNGPAADLSGARLDELLTRHGTGRAAEDPSPSLEAVLEAMRRRVPFQGAPMPLAIGGAVRWWQLNGKPIHDAGGAFAGYRGVGSDVTQAHEAEARIAHLASHDVLTGLANRAAFQGAIARACDPRNGPAAAAALLYLDLDGFKGVNDRAGHSFGDRLLQRVAERLRARAKAADGIFRLGGDEFAILLPCPAPVEGHSPAAALAGALVADIARPFRIEGAQFEIGVSIGIAHTPRDAADPTALLARADLALYAAKAAGKGSWRTFDPALEHRSARTRRLDADMRQALARDELDLHYQPLVRFGDGAIVGFEALLRWHKPGQGWISPGEIIPIAEETGFIVEIGTWALQRACRDALAWPGQRIAVNISSLQFRMPDFYDRVAEALDATGIAPERLEIEITESIILDLTGEVMETLRRLRERGVRIVLDDFGTGYSSLSYLTRFHFNKIKIDRTFIRDLQNRPDTVAVVEAITALARALAMDVTVEGVETPEQAEILRGRRCDTAQGFLYSPARPAAEIPALMRRFQAHPVTVLTDAA